MGRFRFFNCEIVPAINGSDDLTLEQAGLYWKLLFRIYATEDNLALIDEQGRSRELDLARKCKASARSFRRVFAELLALGRLSTEPVDKAVYIRDERASNTIRLLGDRFDQVSIIGRSNAGKPNAERGKSTTYAVDPSVAEAVRYQIPESERESTTPTTRTNTARPQEEKSLFSGGRDGSLGQPTKARKNGTGHPAETTIKDPLERLSRFQKAIADRLGPTGWQTIASAMNVNSPDHSHALQTCKRTATALGKGWPLNWPTNSTPAAKSRG